MKTSKLDIADYLESEEMIAEYLNTVLEDGDSSDLIVAIGHIADQQLFMGSKVYLLF